MPSFGAFCLNEPSERFINFASFDTGVLAFECIFNSLISDAVYSLRAAFLFAAFLATSISNLIRSGLITRSHSSSSELMIMSTYRSCRLTMNRFTFHKGAVIRALQMYRHLMGVPCAPVCCVHSRCDLVSGMAATPTTALA
jgi:hypothetical protein